MNDLTTPPGKDAPIHEQQDYWRGLLTIDPQALGASTIMDMARRELERLDLLDPPDSEDTKPDDG